MSDNYVVYHLHSDDSLLDSVTKFREYVDLAVQNGQKAIASTEHGKPSSWVSKKLYCDKRGVKFIHGVEIYLTESLTEKKRDNYHTVLLAKNFDGVLELNRMVSLSCDKEHFYYTNRLSFDEFLALSDNIITTSACLASPLHRLPEDNPYYMLLAKKYDYLEIQPHVHPDQIAFNRRLYELSQKLGKPLIAGTDTHSSSDYKSECRTILTQAKGKSYDDDQFDLAYKTYDELVRMFEVQNALPREVYLEAIRNTNVMADQIEEFQLDTSIKYPILYGTREMDSEKFTETVERKFAEKLNEGIIPPEQEQAFREAIDEEMRVFRKLKMDGFMLSMSELISWCKEQGMAIGTARGSVGGSRVAYVSDIIDLNPETWHTVFSRFCNEDRQEIGDIDIDVVESDRPTIFQHIIGRFGADKTARVASYGTIKAKGVIDEVCRAKMYAWNEAHGRKKNENTKDNPYNYDFADRVKEIIPPDFDKTMENARKKDIPIQDIPEFDAMKSKFPEIFYYFDGLWGTKVSQSVHPAGMVISPITLMDNYGTFDKDGETCLMMDMDEAHEVGAAKYDFLVLKTVQVIRDTCKYIGVSYPRSHEVNWDDQAVWADMRRDLTAIFQFEGKYAADCFKKFRTNSIFDMSIVTACIRPSGASYRNELLARIPHSNPSEIIDDLLKDNLGYLIYQEDTIKFLQQICGLTGSEADNVRRAIGRKQQDRLEAALPAILEGYCSKSDKPREVAEKEAQEFLKIIADSASYQFGMNHSIAYCMLGYYCGFFRHYYPLEFLTAFLNDAANEDDIRNGTMYANKVGIQITMPKWGISRGDYAFDREHNIIAKGLTSIKYMSMQIANELYDLAKNNTYTSFMDLLCDINDKTSLDSRQLEILTKIDFFSDFGNQRELLRMEELFFGMFKRGAVKQVKKEVVDGTGLEPIFNKYAIGVTKSGGAAKSYTIIDVRSIMREVEKAILAVGMSDLGLLLKVRNFYDSMGYFGYTTGREEDRRKLFVQDVFPVKRKKDGVVFGYSIVTKSIGSGREGRFTVFNGIFNKDPIHKEDVIVCLDYERDGQYFRLKRYQKLYD